MRCAFILFTGDRRREEAAKSLPPGTLARIQRRTARVISRLPGAQLFTTGDRLAGATRLAFSSHGLPQLVHRTTDMLFDRGYDRVILLAGDVEGITTAILQSVIDDLERTTAHAVIGPSGDGGFYLAAFNARPQIDWSSVGWFRESAAGDLARLTAARGFSLSFSPQVDDIDDRSDLERLARTSPSSAVRAFLRSLLFTTIPGSPESSVRTPAVGGPTSPRSPPSAVRL